MRSANQLALGADDVAEIQVVEHQLPGLRQVVPLDEKLELLAAVVDVGEDELPLAADGERPPRNPQPQAGGLQLLGRLLAVGRPDAGRLQVPIEAVGIRHDSRVRQPLALVTPVLNLIVELGH